MKYRNLGNTGLKVSAVGLGTNSFGKEADEPTSIHVVNRALDSGVNFIDTSDSYQKGRSEEYVGKAMHSRRSQTVIATKFSSPMGDGPNERGGSRSYMIKAVEASLRRLQTDYIDFYQLHWPDPSTRIEETLRALDDLVRSGKVRYIGCSNFGAWQLSEAMWTSRVNNLHSFATVQTRYNLFSREIEAEVVPCCRTYGVGVIPWAPLAGGFLTGKYRRGEEDRSQGRLASPARIYGDLFTENNWNKLGRLQAFAGERGHAVGELAIAWLLAKPVVSTVIAGARNTEQVAANAAGAAWDLTPEEVAEVDTISAG